MERDEKLASRLTFMAFFDLTRSLEKHKLFAAYKNQLLSSFKLLTSMSTNFGMLQWHKQCVEFYSRIFAEKSIETFFLHKSEFKFLGLDLYSKLNEIVNFLLLIRRVVVAFAVFDYQKVQHRIFEFA